MAFSLKMAPYRAWMTPVMAVAQTTVHTIRCTLWRRQALEVSVHPRSLSESLFQALVDVGMGVGLVPSGIVTLPVILLS